MTQVRMTHVRTKLIVAGVAVAVAVTFLAVAGVKEGWVYSLEVDEFVQSEQRDRRVRLVGMVGDENLQSNPGLLVATFDLLGESERVRVEYNGVIPDLFRANHEVVVEGQLDPEGLFQADTLLTKCASKYEAEGDQPPADHPILETGEAPG